MYKDAIVVNAKGNKVEYVQVIHEAIFENASPDPQRPEYVETNKIRERILGYELLEGEALVYDDVSTALKMKSPQWIGTHWVETVPSEETQAHAAHIELPIQKTQGVSLVARLDDLEERVKALERGDDNAERSTG